MACSLPQLNFTSDLNNGAWESSMPFPAPIAVPTADNIIAELDMYTSAISTPLPATDDAPSPASDASDCLFRPASPCAPLLRHKRAAPTAAAALRSAHAHKRRNVAKHEQLFEPVTPTSRKVLSMSHRMHATGAPPPALVPLSPSQSLCTEEEDAGSGADGGASVVCVAAAGTDGATALPVLSKEATAKRRAMRRAAMKRNRSRRVEGCVKTEATTVKSDCELSAEPVDKKAARAIRNREAAMKSRVEAKQKMQKLQDENDTLNVKVKSLAEENKALTAQLKSLLQHTYGVSVGDGQDVREVFNMLAPVGCRS